MIVLALFVGCSSSPPSEAPPAEAAAEAPAAPAKFEQATLAVKAEARPGAVTPPTPIGAEGQVSGTISFTPVADDASDPQGDTQVDLRLTWGEGEDANHTVDLGQHAGPCEEIEPPPVGAPERQRKPLWAVRCGPQDAELPDEVYVLQVGALLSAIRPVEPSKQLPDRQRYRPVARIPLVKGAVLERGT